MTDVPFIIFFSEILKNRTEVSYNDIEEMGRNATDTEILLRVVEIAAANKTPDCQTWAKENLLRCLNGAKNDVLVLMNLFELLERLDAKILSSSMEILFQLRHDPIISSMGMSYCSLVKERDTLFGDIVYTVLAIP